MIPFWLARHRQLSASSAELGSFFFDSVSSGDAPSSRSRPAGSVPPCEGVARVELIEDVKERFERPGVWGLEASLAGVSGERRLLSVR